MNILVTDDDIYICNLLVNFLKQNGYMVKGASNAALSRKLIKKYHFDVILCDYRLPDSDGAQLLSHIKSVSPSTKVIIITAYSDVRIAVNLIKSGAFDYIAKPVQPEELLLLIKKACEMKKSERPETQTEDSFHDDFIIGKSLMMKNVMNEVSSVASTDLSVLIEGETGSGKEYIARAIHYASNRRNRPFVPVDCGAIPKDLANSELFGHVKGAFTGAINDKTGYYEQADGGTLFLDEVGNLLPENQLKLLRSLQEGIIHKVGDNKPVKVDVRIISASNVSLLHRIKSLEFRDDLYHRLNGFRIQLPALRDRKEDIMIFADFFIRKANAIFNKNVRGFDKNVIDMFEKYRWYGNLRELKNIIFRTVLLSRDGLITSDLLPDEMRSDDFQPDDPGSIEEKIKDITELKEATYITEKEVITNALQKSNYNKSKAARMLNIDRKTLYNKIKLYKLDFSK